MNETSPIEILTKYFKKYFPLNEIEAGELGQRFTERKIKRRGVLLQEGDVCRHFNFVVSGCCKMYAIDQAGKEHSEQWSIPNFAPMDFIPATVGLTVFDSGQVRIDQQYFQEFIRQVEEGNIHLNISRSFMLDEISQAHQLMETNSGAGKIVVLNQMNDITIEQ